MVQNVEFFCRILKPLRDKVRKWPKHHETIKQWSQPKIEAMNLATALSMVPGYVLQMRNDQLPASKVETHEKHFKIINLKLILKARNYCLQ